MNLAAQGDVTLPCGYEQGGRWNRAVRLRPWSARDEIRFHEEAESTAAAQVTALLAACLIEPHGAAFARSLAAGDRVALVLQLRRLTLGDRMPCVAECPECGEQLDVDLTVSGLLVPPYESPALFTEVAEGNTTIRVRLPNGEDLEECAGAFRRDQQQAVALLLRRCVQSPEGNMFTDVAPALAERIGDSMAALDPQAELSAGSRCPACERLFSFVFDAAGFVLEEIRMRGRRRLREVHLLASAYHWSEAEILDLSEGRRRHYLALIEGVAG